MNMNKVLKVCMITVATLSVALLIYFVANVIVASRDASTPVATQTAKPSAPVTPKPTPPTIAELLSLVNAERAKVGVAPLIEDVRLDQSAQFKADDMATRGYFAHQDPVTGRNNGLDKANGIDTGCSWVSENIYWGKSAQFDTSIEAVKWWMSSAPHKAALLDSTYIYTGFGIDNGRTVEHFCRP